MTRSLAHLPAMIAGTKVEMARAMKRKLVAPLVLSLGLLGCGSTVVTGRPPSGQAWLLVSPPDTPEAATIYHYDVTQNRVSDALELPEGAAFPHGLAFDGSSLWVSALAPDPTLFELDASDGSLRSQFALQDQGAEGIAAVGTTLWAAVDRDSGQILRQFDPSGSEIAELVVADRITGLGAEGNDLLVLCDNGRGANTIDRIEPDTGKRTKVTWMPYRSRSRVAIGFDGARVVTVEPILDRATGRFIDNALRWLDPTDGAVIDQRPMAVRGTISAIAWRIEPR